MRRLAIVLFLFVGLMSYAIAEEKPKVERPQTEQETCITEECHGDRASKAVVHDPVSEGSCEACHETVDVKEHTYKLIAEEPKLCFECHDEFAKKHVHGAFKEGQCSQCHETHTSDNENRLLAETAGEMCLKCHDVTENAAYVHGPTSVNECTLCHAPHESDHEKRLVMALDQLCVFCHVTTKEELDSIEFNHEPVRDNCVGCHSPHGADNWELLKAEAPDLCYSCHEEIQTMAQDSKHQHNAVLEKGGCLECHTPHASSVRPLLASAPTTLCMTCHSKPLGVSATEVMPAFTDQLADKAYLHGPIKEGDCSGCHMTHGSDHFRILAAEYPPGFYSSFEEAKYELCFGCHERTLVLTATTDNLTNFRNGDQNLHFAHVNKERRGRTCRACHQTHASNQLKHIRKSVPYGGWKDLPINFSKTNTGGLCDPGCHLEVGYDRETAVDYTATPSGRTFRPRLKVGSAAGIKQISSAPKE